MHDPNRRASMIASAVKFVNDYGLDGINDDMEWYCDNSQPGRNGSTTNDDKLAFYNTLTAELHKYGKLSTLDIAYQGVPSIDNVLFPGYHVNYLIPMLYGGANWNESLFKRNFDWIAKNSSSPLIMALWNNDYPYTSYYKWIDDLLATNSYPKVVGFGIWFYEDWNQTDWNNWKNWPTKDTCAYSPPPGSPAPPATGSPAPTVAPPAPPPPQPPSALPPPCEKLLGGLIPCGRNCDDASTPWIETAPCNLCSLVLMMQLIIEFLVRLSAALALISIIFGGFLHTSSLGNEGNISRAKSMIKYTLIGFFIILIAWAIVDSILTMAGYIDPVEGKWYNMECELPTK